MTNYTNRVLYTGVTNDLVRRVFEHKNGLNKSSFTKKYNIHKLIWFQEFQSPDEAIAAEKKIKGWTRVKKIALIKETNSDFKEIAV